MTYQDIVQEVARLRFEEQVTLYYHLQQMVVSNEEPVQSTPPDLSDIQGRIRAEMPSLRARHHVASLALFGSHVRGTPRPDSDLDILVTYTETPSLLDLARLQEELSELTGVQVDLVPENSLRPEFRSRILGEAVAV